MSTSPFTEEDVYRLLQTDWDERGYAKRGRGIFIHPDHKHVIASWYPHWRVAWAMYGEAGGVHHAYFSWRVDTWAGCERADVLNEFGHIVYIADPRCPPDRIQLRGENEDSDGPPHQEFVFGEKS